MSDCASKTTDSQKIDSTSGVQNRNPFVVRQLGVWRVLSHPESKFPTKKWPNFVSAVKNLDPIRRLITEVYYLGPTLFIGVIFAKFFEAIESSVLLYQASRIFKIIEEGLTEGKPDANAIIQAILGRIAFMMVTETVDWWYHETLEILRHRTIRHFEEYLLKFNLNIDLPSLKYKFTDHGVEPTEAWRAFVEMIEFATKIGSVMSLILFIFQSDYSSGGYLFVLLCIAKPVISIVTSRDMYGKAFVYHSNNTHYSRLEALRELGEEDYRQDVISGHLGSYIVEEYRKARSLLGDTLDTYPASIFWRHPSPLRDILIEVARDLPMVYYAANAILNPAKFSLSSIAILERSSSSLRYKLEQIWATISAFSQFLDTVRSIYDMENFENTMKDGTLAYPSLENINYGMSLELRNVTFEYPGSKSKVKSLDNVSFTIKAGQLVVVVGANGSGKSTIIKLLTRLYDCTSGEVLVDGRDIREYKIADLRRATATLTQDHNLYPLSITENIGLGHSPCVTNMDMVMQAAKQGGAHDFVLKLGKEFQTILSEHDEPLTHGVQANDPLLDEVEKLSKAVEVSGGEQQRLVASRTFMRFNSGKIKFLAVDEPSSALDPLGEWELFERLRETQSGKTMVFVTHRFGHLTKFADMILCMKDGSLVESGTHSELMAIDGEYSKLYNVQSRAFAPETVNATGN